MKDVNAQYSMYLRITILVEVLCFRKALLAKNLYYNC